MSITMRGIQGFAALAATRALFSKCSSKQEAQISRVEQLREFHFEYVGDRNRVGENGIRDPLAIKDLTETYRFVKCSPNRYITGTTDRSSCILLQKQLKESVANLRNNCCRWNWDVYREELDISCFDCQRALDEASRRESGASVYQIIRLRADSSCER
jgi:hypothetical protein